jgi:hypothetical protein
MWGTYVDKRRRDDDTGAELPEDGEDDMLGRDERCDEHGSKNADGAGDEHDEEQAHAQRDVVDALDAGAVDLASFASSACAVSIILRLVPARVLVNSTADLLNTSMEVAVLAARSLRRL